MASNFASILDRPSSEIERPKPLPIGTYLCTVRGQPRYDKSSQKQTPFVEFELVPSSYADDVDEDDLKLALNGKALNEVSFRATFYLTEDASWRLKDFLKHCGLEDDTKSMRQLIDETPNSQVHATLRHENTQDGTGVVARIGKTAPAA